MKRTASLTLGTIGLAVLVLGIAPAASADVTNPADNPHKTVVQGDDGQTYTDGQDTLPGYDDYECTYIPGAWFDFAKNRVYYADGSWIPWTEWDRATGYKEWLDKKDSGSTGGSGSGSSGGSGSDSSGGSTSGGTKGGTKTTTKTTTTTKSGTKSSGTKSSGTAATTATSKSEDAAEPATTPSASPSAAASASPIASPTASPSPSVTPIETVSASPVAAVTSAEDADASAGPAAGIAILGGLAAAGGIAYGATWLVRRGRGAKGGLA